MREVEISLYGKQHEVFGDWLNDNRHCIDIVHVGSGKTHLASLFLPIAASDPKYHKGKDVIYSAPTMGMISSLIWEPLKKVCREIYHIPEKDINNSSMTIKFPNDVFIRCKSAEQKENLRGLNVGIWIADEAALYSEDTLHEILNRLRPIIGSPDTVGRMIVISTPHGTGPLYTLFKSAMANPDQYVVRHYGYEEMQSGNKKFILNQKKIISPLKFEQDYNCSWESVTDQFFYAWDKTKYCAPVFDRGGDLITLHDFNKRVMCAMVVQVQKAGTLQGTMEVLKTYAINDCSTEGIAKAIRADFPKRRISSIIDMSGTQVNRDTTSPFGVTDRIILEKYGFLISNNGKVNPLIADTDNSSNAFITRGGLIVQPEDELALAALSTYHFEDGTRKKLVKYHEQAYAHIDGLGDCIRYGINHFFPIQHADTGIAEYVGMDQRYARLNRPGIEHMPQSPLFKGGPTWSEILGTSDDAPDYMIS